MHLFGNESKQPPLGKLEQNLKSIPVSAQIGVRRSDRQQKQILAKANSSNAATKANAPELFNDKEFSSASFDERFRLLPQFDHGNYKSPTQWPVFGGQRPQKRVLTAPGAVQETPAKKYALKASVGWSDNGTPDCKGK